MRLMTTFLAALSLGLMSVLAADPVVPAGGAAGKVDLSTPKAQVSYSIGVDIGAGFKRQEIEVDVKALAAGIADSMTGKTQMTDEQMKEVLMKLRKELMAKIHAQAKADGAKNTQDGETYLVENAKKEGVKTTATGLQYKVIKSGKGKQPKLTDTVKVHYHGSLITGDVFDSSVERGQPVSFAVNQVIAGWTEALQMMKEGDKWQLVIPPALAYGENGAGGKIGPNSVLIFDVELLEVE